jgi:hypothetical protein
MLRGEGGDAIPISKRASIERPVPLVDPRCIAESHNMRSETSAVVDTKADAIIEMQQKTVSGKESTLGSISSTALCKYLST